MTVYFDYQCFQQKVGGVSRCFCELIKHMPADIACKILVKASENLYLRDPQLLPDLPSPRLTYDNYAGAISFKGRRRLFTWLDRNVPFFPSFTSINRRYAKAALAAGDFDICHVTMQEETCLLDYLAGKPFVFTVHDMIWELFPTPLRQKWSRQKRLFCQKAAHIVAVSEHTKHDLMRLWQIPEENITVIYHGAPDMSDHTYTDIVGQPYFLFVGRREGYKNFEQTLYAFAHFHQHHPEVMLLCTGSPFTPREQRMIDALHLTDKVRCRYVSDEDLYNLYHYAIAFIFPSIYEGFGIPILEAFANGCPVLLNDTSCFPEIGGDAAVYFHADLQGDSDLSEKMAYIYSLPADQRRRIVDRGRQRAEQFTWHAAAQRLAEVYRKVVGR